MNKVIPINIYRRYLSLTMIIALLLEVGIILQYSLPFTSIIVFLLTCLVAFIVYSKNTRLSFATWWLFIYLICSFLVIACFKYTPYRFTMGATSINDRDFYALANTSIIIIFIFFSTLLFFNNTSNKRKYEKTTNIVPYINQKFLFVVAYSLSLISFVLGLGRMGSEERELPFHLTGVIHFLRTNVVPICALFVYARNKSTNKLQDKSNNQFLLLFFAWTILEMFVRMSKGFLLRSFFPIIFFEIIAGTTDIKKVLRKFSPMIVVFLLMYPVIESMRYLDSFNAAVTEAYSTQDEDGESGTYGNPSRRDYFVRPFNRTFYSGYLFVKDQSYVDGNSFFDFEKAPIILAMNGSARYQTNVIDGYPDGIAHSSGTTSLVDAFLMGGYGLMYIQLIILTIIAIFVDKFIKSRYNNVLSAILAMFYWDLIPRESFSGIAAPMYIRTTFMYLLILFVTWRIVVRKSKELA